MPLIGGLSFYLFDQPIEYKSFSDMARFMDWNPLFKATTGTAGKFDEKSSYQHQDKIIMEKLCEIDLQVGSPKMLAQKPFKDGIILKKLFWSKC